MIARRRPSALVLRWLALGAAGGAALTMGLAALAVPGPWQLLALVLSLVAVAASIGVSVHMHQSVRELEAADERLRQDELALGELQRELEERTELEKELRQAKNAAESAVMAKGEFLATMSHEIRTPLNGITPMLDLLMHAGLAPDHAELVRTAFLSSQQMQRIVDDILDYSKLESNKLDLEVTGFNLRELMDGVIQVMERAAQTKGLRLGLQIDPVVRLPVRGDPVRLRQVLGNLISNAVKFTERGSVSVHVRRLGETAAQHQLRFEVRDTGIGISAEGRKRLFQAFSQADASTTRLYGGTGLGLAISRRIVELMDGRIGVDSEPGAGSTFWFEIPLRKTQGDMPVEDATPRDGRALLLSADPRLRLRLSMLLPNWGLRVSSVETTQEALDRLRTAANQGPPWAYSVVVADLAGMRNTAVALYRNVTRQAAYGSVRLVCLYGDEPVSEELRQGATLLSRQSPDADLREAVLDIDTPPAPAAPASTPTHDPGSAAAPAGSADDTAAAVLASQIPAPPATVVPQGAIAPDTARSDGPRKPRVLLVEDNPVNLMVGQRLLSVLGITCDTASNGEAALLRIAASRYDIVLMDCQMPVMDGYTATRRWREHEAAERSTRRLPIIAMTANAMAGDRQKCLDAGMDDYLAKPVTRSELERCIHRWWDPDAAPAPVEHAMPAPAPISDPMSPDEWTAPAQSSLAPVAPDASAPVARTPSAAVVDRSALPPVIDHEVLDDLRTVLGDEVDRLIDVFLDDTPRLLAALENAVDGPDYDGLREAAHSLKSSSANLGAMSLSAAARRIEAGARERSLERPAVAVALVSNEFARARRMLREGRVSGLA
ncbi:Hybrid sensor histidine kinase/response regulator [Luteimonas sp. 9C]|uniref:hybrid sensor histidine kinase/response regulator n=1 Tax=Luteimonas sp. 9C TaxID=2653148 RepID=UPI0012F25011|nr:hybrid sensor histidine kinase/response regulator [Luteimonas sp. 9C]VXA91902.1 Hybrid sensor histidine kinase/response regulator [Luteimonas sp. 9C]